MKYILEDAEARARLAPDTFRLPPEQDRRRLKIGDFAKLLFMLPEGVKSDLLGDPRGERMWVKIDRVVLSPVHPETNNRPALVCIPPLLSSACPQRLVVCYEGTLDFIEASAGDVVRFSARHIIEILGGHAVARRRSQP